MSANRVAAHILSFLLPVTVLVIFPSLIEEKPGIFFDSLFVLGCGFMVAGLYILFFTISLFVKRGKGTLAPWNPTQSLVVSGPYRYVRNPMITGVMSILLGESMTMHSTHIFIWLITFFVINTVYFVLSEEPGLVKRFGEEYKEYRRHVPMWIPRLTPWKSGSG